MRQRCLAGAVAGMLLCAAVAPAWGGEAAPYPQLFPGPAQTAAARLAPVAPGTGKAAGAEAYSANPDGGGFRLGVTAAAVGVVGLMGLAVVAITSESSRTVSGGTSGTVAGDTSAAASSSTPGT